MPSYDDANLILRLYELRREEKMRQARAWFMSKFTYKSAEDAAADCPPGSNENAFARMVVSYWDMVASFLNSELLDKELFYKSGNELLFVYLRISHLLPAWRELSGDPTSYSELEQAGEAMMQWRKTRSPEGFAAFSRRVLGA